MVSWCYERHGSPVRRRQLDGARGAGITIEVPMGTIVSVYESQETDFDFDFDDEDFDFGASQVQQLRWDEDEQRDEEAEAEGEAAGESIGASDRLHAAGALMPLEDAAPLWDTIDTRTHAAESAPTHEGLASEEFGQAAAGEEELKASSDPRVASMSLLRRQVCTPCCTPQAMLLRSVHVKWPPSRWACVYHG